MRILCSLMHSCHSDISLFASSSRSIISFLFKQPGSKFSILACQTVGASGVRGGDAATVLRTVLLAGGERRCQGR